VIRSDTELQADGHVLLNDAVDGLGLGLLAHEGAARDDGQHHHRKGGGQGHLHDQ
jgi:hypothetical protein